MTEKFGSGRFCSRACANAREHSEESKKKIGESVKQSCLTRDAFVSNRKIKNEINYNLQPSFCKICGKKLSYEIRNKVTCSCDCFYKLLLSKKSNKYHSGEYLNVHCDSSWELAYLVYCLEHDIDIVRNKESFKYTYKGKEHAYYPDFIVDNTYIEIKNYWTEQVQAKIDQFPEDKQYKILYGKDLSIYIKYCIEKYGKKF